MKAVVRKSIAYGRRNSDQPEAIISTIKNLLNNNLSSELESALNEFKAFNYGDSANNNSSQSGSSSTTVVSTELFEIKEINIIEDKLLRANLKKIYMVGKKNKSNSDVVVTDMLSLLEEKGIDDSTVINHLNSLKLSQQSESNVNKQEIDNQVKDSALFDMKLLNGIDDKVARGTAKKVYIGCKKDNKSSAEVIEEIKNSISSAGLMNENVEKILGELG